MSALPSRAIPPVDTPGIDPARCPLCGQGNACAEETARASGEPQPPCWCLTAEFPPALRARVPAAARGRACICARCAAAAALAAPAPTC